MAATTFPRWPGDGQGAFVWELAKALMRQGVGVRVIALHTPGAEQHEVIDDIEIFRPRYWWNDQDELLRKDGGGLPITLRRYPLAWLQLAPFLVGHMRLITQQAIACDLVHAHWTLSGAAAVWSKLKHRRPVIVTVQGSDIFQVPQLPLGALFTKHVLERAQRVTTLTESLRRAIVKIGIHQSRISVIANGVDITKFVPFSHEKREKVILFVGYLISRKGVSFLLDAGARVLAHHPDYQIVLLGEGPEEATLRAQAARLGITEAVKFLGFQPQSVVRDWMRRAQLLVLPSVEEGQGVVLLEALASATPVIGSAVDGIAEVITHDVGRLFPPGDTNTLAQHMQDLIEDDVLRTTMGEAARRRAEELYDWNQLAAQYIALYKQVTQLC